MLKTAMQSQLDDVKLGLNQLQAALHDIQESRHRYAASCRGLLAQVHGALPHQLCMLPLCTATATSSVFGILSRGTRKSKQDQNIRCSLMHAGKRRYLQCCVIAQTGAVYYYLADFGSKSILFSIAL